MTREQALQQTDVKALFDAMKADSSLLKDAEVREHFAKIRQQTFVKDICDEFGSYDPDTHYDFRKKNP